MQSGGCFSRARAHAHARVCVHSFLCCLFFVVNFLVCVLLVFFFSDLTVCLGNNVLTFYCTSLYHVFFHMYVCTFVAVVFLNVCAFIFFSAYVI